MKILFAITRMTGAVGRAERALADIASRLAIEGHQVSLLSFDADGDSFYPLHPAIRGIFVPVGGDPVRRTTLVNRLRRLPALRRALVREKPDVAVGIKRSMFLPLGLALLGTGIPVIGSEQAAWNTGKEGSFDPVALRLTLPFLRAVTAPTAAVRDFYPAASHKKVHVLPNPVAAFAGVMRRGSAERIILAVGRLDAAKDHATLIDAFARLTPDHPDWRLRIIGDGPLRPALTAQIAACALQDRIDMPGIMADLSLEYRQAAIFAMPSLQESFGLSLAEALASGLPGIGFSDCLACRDLIQNDHNGILVGAGDRAWRLAEGLGRLMRDEPLRARLGGNAPQTVRRYDLATVAGQWTRLLQSVARQ